MSRWLFASLVVALSTGPRVFTQTAEQEVLKAQQAWVEARRAGDAATLARLTTDDVLIVGPAGQLIDKKGVSAIAAVPKIAAREGKTQVFGDVAVVTGIASGVGPNGDQENHITRVWRKQNGQWLYTFGHVTPIQAPAAATTPPQARQPAPTDWPDAKTQDERDVLNTQRGLEEAFARKDASAYSQLTADSFVRIDNNGGVTPRAAFLKTVTATPEVKRAVSNLSAFRNRVYGSVAISTCINTGAAGGPLTRFTRVFLKQDGTWKQLVGQTTPIVP